MTTDFGTRLTRIETVLEQLAPRSVGFAERLECARLVADGRRARGEPEPDRVPRVPAVTASWASQELCRRLNTADARMHAWRAAP